MKLGCTVSFWLLFSNQKDTVQPSFIFFYLIQIETEDIEDDDDDDDITLEDEEEEEDDEDDEDDYEEGNLKNQLAICQVVHFEDPVKLCVTKSYTPCM